LLPEKKSEQELKDEEMGLFTKYYSEWKGGRRNTNEFYKTIPRFYYRVSSIKAGISQHL
jgi:serine/threonine-protein phosphatase 2A regulatory subunit B''